MNASYLVTCPTPLASQKWKLSPGYRRDCRRDRSQSGGYANSVVKGTLVVLWSWGWDIDCAR